MRLQSPVDFTGNLIMVEKSVLGETSTDTCLSTVCLHILISFCLFSVAAKRQYRCSWSSGANWTQGANYLLLAFECYI